MAKGVPGVSLPSRCDASSVFIKSFTLRLSLSPVIHRSSFRRIILLVLLLKVKSRTNVVSKRLNSLATFVNYFDE